MEEPEIMKYGALDAQVCVPSDWTDEQIVTFANAKNPAGTEHGWSIRRRGDKALAGADERVTCLGRPFHIHVMLDC